MGGFVALSAGAALIAYIFIKRKIKKADAEKAQLIEEIQKKRNFFILFIFNILFS